MLKCMGTMYKVSFALFCCSNACMPNGEGKCVSLCQYDSVKMCVCVCTCWTILATEQTRRRDLLESAVYEGVGEVHDQHARLTCSRVYTKYVILLGQPEDSTADTGQHSDALPPKLGD